MRGRGTQGTPAQRVARAISARTAPPRPSARVCATRRHTRCDDARVPLPSHRTPPAPTTHASAAVIAAATFVAANAQATQNIVQMCVSSSGWFGDAADVTSARTRPTHHLPPTHARTAPQTMFWGSPHMLSPAGGRSACGVPPPGHPRAVLASSSLCDITPTRGGAPAGNRRVAPLGTHHPSPTAR